MKRLSTGLFLLAIGTTGPGERSPAPFTCPVPDDRVSLRFSMTVHESVYEQTNFGEPPQIAIWLAHPETGTIRTVWVANRAGRRLWKGKFECPTALPIWEYRHRAEKSDFQARGLLKRLLDAVTGATPDGGPFSVSTAVERGSRWRCYVEVNLSADFNRDFPYRDETGMPDPEVNGQPSLVYEGDITALPGSRAVMNAVGRSDQWVATGRIIADLTGITTALDAVTNIEVHCSEQ
ncbi:hypothetical protein JXO52_13570 [bacterium]|nr:hypothetical protein [bacterium]